MKVEIGTKVFYVGWKHESPLLNTILEQAGLSVDQVKKMTMPEVAQAVGLKLHELPTPSVTHCILTNADKQEVIRVKVNRHYKDVHDKNKARKFSLDKLLMVMFAGEQNKTVRRKFWEAYLHRDVRSRKEKATPVVA